MTTDTITPEQAGQAGLRRAALMGVVAGLRSQMPLGVLARAVDQGEVTPPTGVLGILLRSPQGRRVLKLSALGEAIIDKTPLPPNRLRPKPFIGRLGFGALAAATLAQTQGTPALQAALRGAVGAGIGSICGSLFRTGAGRLTGFPDLVVALVEDTIAVGLARSAIQPDALAEMARDARASAATARPADPASPAERARQEQTNPV